MKEVVETVQAYKTSDGQIYEDAEAARAKQTEINVMKVIADAVDDFYYYNIDKDDVIRGIYEHINEIIQVVKEETK